MKKFPKISIVFLALAAILTAFSVVAMAEKGAPEYVNKGGHGVDTTFESWSVGEQFGETTGDFGVIAVQEAYPGGNKFLHLVGTGKSEATISYNTLGGEDASLRNAYSFSEYPIVAIDMDVMTPNGDWGLYSASNPGNNAGFYISPYLQNEQQGNIFKQISFGNLGLPSTAYVWHHVTVIYEYSCETVNGATTEYVTQTAYVNGKATASSYSNGKIKMTVADASSLWIGALYLKTSKYETTSQQAIDNVSLSYYEEGYDTSKIPTLIYNGSWKAPFGKVVASVSVGEETSYYDSFDGAYGYAKTKPGATIQLYDNVKASVVIDSELTVDTRKFDAEENPTGKKYTFTPTVTTTVGYALRETESGSGIWKSMMGDFAVISSDRAVTPYFTEERDLASIFQAAAAGSVVKLLRDVETDAVFTVKVNNLIFDLNGHELKRVCYYGDVYNAQGSGDYPDTPNGTPTAAKTGALFTAGGQAKYYNNFKVTSSDGRRGRIYNVSVNADTYYRDGKIEKRVIKGYGSDSVLYDSTQSGTVVTFENIDIYTQGFISSCSDSASDMLFNVRNVKFYQMASSPDSPQYVFCFGASGGLGNYELNAEESAFYLNEGAGIVHLASPKESSQTSAVTVIFTDCDIINAEGRAVSVSDTNSAIDSLTFVSCRIYGFTSYTHEKIFSSHGTVANFAADESGKAVCDIPRAKDGWENMNLSAPITLFYTVLTQAAWSATDDAVESVDFAFETREQVCTFTAITTKEIEATVNGNTISLIPGISDLYADKSLRVYADTEADELLNRIYLLKDAGGNVYESILGITSDGFRFDWNDCGLAPSAETKYVGGIKDASFNLGFLSGFRYNLYIPVDARLTDVSVDGFEEGNVVLIGGEQYTVYSKLVGTAAAADANLISATFKVDGKDYSQSWSINAVQYAEMLIAYPDYDSEKTALGNMVKFIKEAVLFNDAAAYVSALNDIIESAGLDLTYGSYTGGNPESLGSLRGAITDAQYIIYSGVASCKFYTKTADTPLTFTTARGENIGFTRGGNEEEGYYVILDSMRVYDIVETITITSGSAKAEYSMLDYLTAMEGSKGMELAKALYEFGIAAKAYKKDIIASQ